MIANDHSKQSYSNDISAEQHLLHEITHEEKNIYKLLPDPLQQFDLCFKKAQEKNEEQPDAFALSTCTPRGYPNVRYLLFKGISEGQFLFFTNYHSQKSQELLEHPWAAMAFLWKKAKIQVRIQGRVSKTTQEQSLFYFQSRPKGSQISACISPQSQKISHRRFLEEKWKRVEEQSQQKKNLDCPTYWGGYALIPHNMEFWFEGQDRLHDRFLYTPTELLQHAGPYQQWNISRLAP
jgi:pyridoxamine 5'-phosphate oxidase